MTFSPTIDLGNVLTAASLLWALYQFHRVNTRRIAKMEFRVNLMWKRFAHRFNMDENLEADDED